MPNKTLALSPPEYWARFESDGGPIDSVSAALSWASEVSEVLDKESSSSPKQLRRQVFRGQRNSAWSLTSTLVRHLANQRRLVNENAVRWEETQTLIRLRQWSHAPEPSMVTPALQLLAAHQHQGGLTRLIDVTHSLLVALWFAVDDANEASSDGRVFAMTYDTDLSESYDGPLVEANPTFFWHYQPNGLERKLYVWTPPPYEPRMAMQHAAFLIGQVPDDKPGDTQPFRQLPDRDHVTHASWKEAVSVWVRPYKVAKPGRPILAGNALFTQRVAREAKLAIMRELHQFFGMEASTVYPDTVRAVWGRHGASR